MSDWIEETEGEEKAGFRFGTGSRLGDPELGRVFDSRRTSFTYSNEYLEFPILLLSLSSQSAIRSLYPSVSTNPQGIYKKQLSYLELFNVQLH